MKRNVKKDEHKLNWFLIERSTCRTKNNYNVITYWTVDPSLQNHLYKNLKLSFPGKAKKADAMSISSWSNAVGNCGTSGPNYPPRLKPPE